MRLVVPTLLLLSALSFAAAPPPALKADYERLNAAVAAATARMKTATETTLEHMKAAQTQTPTKEDDAAILDAWKAQLTAMEAMLGFSMLHQDELVADIPDIGARLAQGKDLLAAQRKLVTAAETEGAVKVINRFGDNIRKEFAKAGGRAAVGSKAGWVDTTFAVKTGDIVHLEASGTWTVTPKVALFDADGIDRGGFRDYRAYKGAKLGALLCRVGASDKIYFGKSQRFMADQDGSVHCRVNDTDLDNNVGELTVERVAEAAK